LNISQAVLDVLSMEDIQKVQMKRAS